MVDRSVRIVVVGVLMMWLSLPGSLMSQTLAVVGPAESPLPANVPSVTIHANAASLRSVLLQIVRQAGLVPYYSDFMTKDAVRVTLDLDNVSVTDAFANALRGTGLQASIIADRVIFENVNRPVMSVMVGTISGKVLDAKTRLPLRGATVSIQGTGLQMSTRDDGTFRLTNVPSGVQTVNVRLLGYLHALKTVTVIDGSAVSVDIALTQSVSSLDQVVVTGTVIGMAQKAVPNAMTVITAKDLEQRGITQIEQLFRGVVPGLFVENRGSGAPLDEVTMFSRGATALQLSATSAPATTPIKTYLDGVELSNPQYLSQIDPKSIERIEIVTGPQASTIYGSGAINGVMQIFTKRSTSMTPQVTAAFLSGLVENDFRPTMTPQHDYSLQVNGVEGHWSYNAGGSWNYIGPWAPAKQTTRTSGFGGARLERGPIVADASIRIGKTTNLQRGRADQVFDESRATGLYPQNLNVNIPQEPMRAALDGQTLGLTLGYTPTRWWSHQLILGSDESSTASQSLVPGYWAPNDSLTNSSYPMTTKTSVQYTSTVQVPVTMHARAVVSLGADEWQSLITNQVTSNSKIPNFPLGGPSLTITRVPAHNAGAFLQGQVGVWDATFLTYGLRAEWNPNYGSNAQPNLSTRYGVAQNFDLGLVTAKLRASYGRATRPPTNTQKNSVAQSQAAVIALYGRYDSQLANPDLGPEYQQGGEGGLEFYLGTHGSLTITRYNQTVEGLIFGVVGDSVRSQVPNPSTRCGLGILDAEGYAYCNQTINVNVGSVRNQGWELQGTVNLGPLTTQSTYSWTKSRVMGVAPQYSSLLTGPQFLPGARFVAVPEHTWAMTMTYAHAATMIAFDLNGTGFLVPGSDKITNETSSFIRLAQNRLIMNRSSFYVPVGPGYTMANMNASHRFSKNVEGVFEMKNLANFYQNDYSSQYAVIGRQSQVGIRVRM